MIPPFLGLVLSMGGSEDTEEYEVEVVVDPDGAVAYSPNGVPLVRPTGKKRKKQIIKGPDGKPVTDSSGKPVSQSKARKMLKSQEGLNIILTILNITQRIINT